jgi:hypothetical protein
MVTKRINAMHPVFTIIGFVSLHHKTILTNETSQGPVRYFSFIIIRDKLCILPS